jgi:hypothetical protein
MGGDDTNVYTLFTRVNKQQTQTHWLSVLKRTLLTEPPPLVGVVPNSEGKKCRGKSATDPYGPLSPFSRLEAVLYPSSSSSMILQTNYIQENMVTPGIEPGTSGSAARNSDH